MDLIRNYLENRKPLDIFYPPDQVEGWNLLKERYSNLGYHWCDFSIEPTLSKAKNYDKKNIKKYNKLKKKEMKLRRSFKNNSCIVVVHQPPRPTNEERFLKLKKWSENNYYNITNITIYLYMIHKLKPCRDYEPDNLIEVYNRYSSRHFVSLPPPPTRNNYFTNTEIFRRESYENNIRGSQISTFSTSPAPIPSPRRLSSAPTAPDPLQLPPPPNEVDGQDNEITPNYISLPPTYKDIIS